MNEFELMRALERIADTGNRLEKIEILTEICKTELGRYVVTQAYSGFITFGVTVGRRDKARGVAGPLRFTVASVGKLLTDLSTRALTGNAASEAIDRMMTRLSDDGAELLYRILAKDLKCGIGEAAIAQAAPGLFPVFAVMRAHPFEEKRVKAFPVRGEFKLDGNRNTFLALKGHGGFFTRTGKRVSALDFLVPAVMETAKLCIAQDMLREVLLDDDGELSFMLDGEAMMGLFEDTGKLRKKDTDAEGAELHLYDILSYADFDAAGAQGPTLDERKANLATFVNVARQCPPAEALRLVPSYLLGSMEEVYDFYARARATTLASYLARGDAEREAQLLKTTIDKATGLPKVMEGAMIKDRVARYEKKKSHAWLKIKAEETEDLIIVGVFSGKPGTKYEHALGGAIVDRQGVRVRIGGGWSDRERFELWEAWKKDAAKINVAVNVGDAGVSLSPEQATGLGLQFDLIGRMIEVEFHEVTPDGSLRHPRFVRFRDDKNGEIEDKEAHVAAQAA